MIVSILFLVKFFLEFFISEFIDVAIIQPSYENAVDTTAAGDTFTGYFVAIRAAEGSVKEALDTASKAAAIACMHKGAAASIPMLSEVKAKIV